MVDQDLLDQVAASVADLYREVEASLIKTVADELKKDLIAPTAETKLDAVRKLRAAAAAVYDRLQKTKSATVKEAIRQAYRDGRASALTGLPVSKAIRNDARDAMKQTPGAAIIENIANALHRDLGVVEGNILRAPEDAYRRVQAAVAARIALGTATRRQASQAAWARLVDQGIVDFTDRANRRWRLSSYAEMIGRTNAQRAAVQGQMDRLATVGIDLVVISDNTQECKVCRPFESKVLRRNPGPIGKIRVPHATKDGETVEVTVVATLDQARARGLFHPNCRHSASAYLPGVTKLKTATATADPEGDVARQRQRYLERRIRAAKEQQLAALTPEAKKVEAAKVRTEQARLREHLKAHPDLKRLPYREQVGAGNVPPAGGPKGGPVTDLSPAPVAPTAPAPPPSLAVDVEAEKAKSAKAQAEAEAQAQAAEKAKAEAEAQAKAQAEAEAAAKKAQEEAEAKAKAEAEAKKKAEAEAKAKAEALAAAKRAAAEAARRAAEEAARRAAEEAARQVAPGMRHGLRHTSNRAGLKWAKENLPMPADLTDAEKKALRGYTGADYMLVNHGLRGGNIVSTQRAKYDQLLADLDAAFAKSKLPESVVVHRGLGSDFARFLGASVKKPETMEALVGKVFPEHGYMSTSVGWNPAFDGDVYLMLRVPKGHEVMNVMPISEYGTEEREVILRRGTHYVVHAVYKVGKSWHIEVEVVPDDWTPGPDWKPDPYGDADKGFENGYPK
ncbi:phage minor capsid protein [Streptosporangium sp. NPDC001559]|uniref:phage minor capsid protein n=1 Tax=Streptosporangium sp. NPDC001559 TaxID=3366187 RepID=UPI0036E1E527